MKIKTLLSAAHAAGYAMAPSEEQFHAPDGGTARALIEAEQASREFAARSNLPALPGPKTAHRSDSWLKGVLGSFLPSRATA